MNPSSWRGVIPAITTPFLHDLSLDLSFVKKHVSILADAGCTGIVTPGSLGEGATLSLEEKRRLWSACIESLKGRIPTIAAVAAASTAEAITIAKTAQATGCQGLMVLPPYLYKGSWREVRVHFAAIISATPLSCMLYNNPIAYGVDITPAQVVELAAAHANLHAVKESSGDVRRITAIRAEVGGLKPSREFTILVGMDDLIVEGVAAGAEGWIAGLVNALPRESVRLFNLAVAIAADPTVRTELDRLYRWFLPLLRMDTTYDFVQLIKLVQFATGLSGEGGANVRPPRLLPEGPELRSVQQAISRFLSEPRL
ncbi:MAG: dihydrodipicolinate synthase family protein [Phycisphaeraceae bacterium]|nr:dihydrodipicolinate synthase family protein [Phycisphaeraceae bacterium]